MDKIAGSSTGFKMLLSELTKRIAKSLKSQGLDVKDIGYKDLIDGQINFPIPACNIVITEAEGKLVNNVTYNWKTTVSMLLIVSFVGKSEKKGDFERMEICYNLIEKIQDYLILQDFGLDLQNRMIPKKFRNITSKKLAEAGFRLFNLEFWMSYNTDYFPPEQMSTGPLTGIDLSYWLEPNAGIPPTGDSTTAAILELA